MSKSKNTQRRGGRKKNAWTLVTQKQVLGYIASQGLQNKTFAEHLGVTNSTFHNWKNGRCAPDEEIQGRIKALIDGKEKITVAKKSKTNKGKASRAPRGAGSSTLASMTGSAGKAAKPEKKAKAKKKVKKKAKKVVKKVAKVAKKKVAKKARGRVVRKAPASTNGNGSFSLGDWKELEALGQFVRANEAKSPTEISELIGTLQSIAKNFG